MGVPPLVCGARLEINTWNVPRDLTWCVVTIVIIPVVWPASMKMLLGTVYRVVCAVPAWLPKLTVTHPACADDSVAVSVTLFPSEIEVEDTDSVTVGLGVPDPNTQALKPVPLARTRTRKAVPSGREEMV